MSLTIECLVEACEICGIKTAYVDQNQSVLKMYFNDGIRLAMNTHLGILSDAEWRIFRDKCYTYELYKSSGMFVETLSYIDPHATSHFTPFVKHKSLDEIIKDITSTLHLPVIIKRNSGTQGRNVFLCQTLQQINGALTKIYSKHQLEYDHVALAQPYIIPKQEYRVVVFNGELKFAYVKPHTRKEFGGLAKPRLIDDNLMLRRMNEVILCLNRCYPLVYAGIDVIEDMTGSLRVIEINGSPTYSSFIEVNGKNRVVELFKQVVAYFDRQ